MGIGIGIFTSALEKTSNKRHVKVMRSMSITIEEFL
jgi:hypothetical protein